MGRWNGILLTIIVMVGAVVMVPRVVRAGGVVGNGTPASCTEAAFDAALVGGGLVTFDCGNAPFALVVTTGKYISAETSIDGGNRITLSGGGTTWLFDILGSEASLALSNITIANGYAATNAGGAIRNFEIVQTENVTFTNNVTGNMGSGGALYNSSAASAFLRNTRFIDNRSALGGAIYNETSGEITLDNSTLTNNTVGGGGLYGGAIYNSGYLRQTGGSLEHNAVTGPSSDRVGGAIYNTSSGVLILDGVLVRDNQAEFGAAIHGGGTVSLLNSRIIENEAGTIISLSDVDAVRPRLRIVQSEIANNGGQAVQILTADELTIDRSTLALNFSNNAVMYTYDVLTMTVQNSTISGNSYGVYLENTFPYYIVNTTFRNNGDYNLTLYNAGATLKNVIFDQSGNSYPNCQTTTSTLVSEGFNIATDATCNLTEPSDQPSTNTQLGDLADNGGPTRTHLPDALSPAVNRGTTADCPATDQRGVPRPQGVTCDVGAVERATNEGATPTPTPAERLYLPLTQRN